jgi:hypothetical protein
MQKNLIVFASSNSIAAQYFNKSVLGKNVATWGFAEKHRALFNKINVGDAVIFPSVGNIKCAGIVMAAFEDKEPLQLLADENGQPHMIGEWHKKTWGRVDTDGQYGKFIVLIKVVPIGEIEDYREFILTKEGRAWDRSGNGYPHRKDTVFEYQQAWGLINRIVDADK